MKSLIEYVKEIVTKQIQQDKINNEVLLNQAEIIVSHEYTNCLMELQTM